VPVKRNSAVFLVWACFVTRAFFYSVVLPMWEGFDEYAHFGYVQYVAVGRGWLVPPETRASDEILRSITLVPMPWMLRADPPSHETSESYWGLSWRERRGRERELAALPRSLGTQDAYAFVPIESQQPPLNYLLMAAVYELVAGLNLPARVFALRLLNVLLASMAVPTAYLAARRVFGTHGIAIATTAIVVLMPEAMFDAARVSNSGLSVALYSTFAVLMLRIVEGGDGAVLWAGLVVGLGLLTKAFFLAAVPPFVAVVAWAVWKRRTPLRSALGAFGLAAAISAWWYARNLRITGSFSGIIQDAALRHVPIMERLRHAARVNWWTALDSTFFSHIWFGGWSFLQLRAWIYHFFAIVAVLAALGLAAAWVRQPRTRGRLSALAAVYVFFCAGLAYHVLMTFLVSGISSSAGWYLCAVVVPETILAAAGLRTLAPSGTRPYVIGGVALAFALIDLYGMFFVAIPYYTGLLAHKPSGSLEAFHWAALFQMGLGELLRRLATNKPAWVGPAGVAATACLYAAATITLAAKALVAEPASEAAR
jgi:4-amino-4-deoxy-L-arabinose transferase-like glycosyltransferase